VRFDVSGHANHPQYDRNIRERIENILEDTASDDSGKFEEIRELVYYTKGRLENEVLLSQSLLSHHFIEYQ
jgi:hypothetical protein